MKWYSMAVLAVTVLVMSSFTMKDGDPIYEKVDKMPTLKSCMNDNQDAALKCTYKEIINIIVNNLEYPKAAKKAGTEGKAFIEFVVNTEGQVEAVKIKKDLENGCGTAALNAVKTMVTNKTLWNAGEKEGKKVKVKMTMPIMFKLSPEDKK
ncbi:MAG: TonB family protein [Saprospiraceae bacterium]